VPPAPDPCSPAAEPAGVRNYEYDASLAVDPTNRRHIVVSWTQDFADAIVIGTSFDGGQSWDRTVPPGFLACANGPTGENSIINSHVAIGPDGTVYATAVRRDQQSNTAVILNTSPDGGRTWRSPPGVSSAPIVLDRRSDQPGEAHQVEWSNVLADARRPGVAYALWDRHVGSDTLGQGTVAGGTEYVAVTLDAGKTWSAPTAIGIPPDGRVFDAGELVQLSDGTIVDVFDDCPSSGCADESHAAVVRLEQGGWTEPLCVSGGAPPCSDLGGPNLFIHGAAGPGGVLYVASTSPFVDRAPRLYRSRDGGRTFSDLTGRGAAGRAPISGVQVAVGRDGTVGLLYDDQRSADPLNPGDGTTEVWLATSIDNGLSFVEQRLAGPFDRNRVPRWGADLGEYQTLRSDSYGFHAAITVVDCAQPLLGCPTGPTDIFLAGIPR
jgi:hypothetical protein